MIAPPTLLEILGRAVAFSVDDSVVDDPVVNITTDLTEQVRTQWDKVCDDEQKRKEILTLANLHYEELDNILQPLVAKIAANESQDAQETVKTYLMHVPSAIRRFCRHLGAPKGDTLPPGFQLKDARSLWQLLPWSEPWFTPGDRPAEIGDWELVDLLNENWFAETWKAENPNLTEIPPVMLTFCLNQTLRQRLHEPQYSGNGSVLDRVFSQVNHPGMMPLRRLHLNIDPPCLEYEYRDAVFLTGLFREGNTDHSRILSDILSIVTQLAQTLGHLHELTKPIIYRHLRPSHVMVYRDRDEALHCLLLHVGLAEALPDQTGKVNKPRTDPFLSTNMTVDRSLPRRSDGEDARSYVSPQRIQGAPADPRDDVYSLGVLWYQMLTGDWKAGRPGGSRWRQRLLSEGMAEPLVELLESCFEDDPTFRPMNGTDLFERLREAKQSNKPTPKPSPVTEPISRRPRRRTNVDDIFNTLEKEAPELQKTLTNSLGMKFVLMQPGTFVMGADRLDPGARENEHPPHEVTITQPFYLGLSPVTQGQYEKIMGSNPARFHPKNGGSPDHPVETISWHNALQFCEKLSARSAERDNGYSYRLPTEAEWEYACRGGTRGAFHVGDTLGAKHANFDAAFPFGKVSPGQALQKTTKPGAYPANYFGLHDMHGNVWEWCADWLSFGYYRNSPKRDPQGPESGQFRVIRGGSWKNHAVTCRSAYRNGLSPALKNSATGFRVVLVVK